MRKGFASVLIISDIEGSSGCWNYRGSSFMTEQWSRACVDMTRDVNAVVSALLDAGVREVTVQDFHRTGYNLLPEGIDQRARVRSGYSAGPVPGIGSPGGAEAVLFMGMHAASGTKGFLAHTLTSRIRAIEVDGRPLAEVELFAASLAPYGLRPIFFSGCPVACAQAERVIPGIDCHPIDKTAGPQGLDAPSWRRELARRAVRSLENRNTVPYAPAGPFKAVVTLRDGPGKARKLARRWGLKRREASIFLEASDMNDLYSALIQLAYLTPLVEKLMPWPLVVHKWIGRLGLEMVRRRIRRGELFYGK